MFWKMSSLVMPVATKLRAHRSAAPFTSLREKKIAFGLPVVPLEVCRRSVSEMGTASMPVGYESRRSWLVVNGTRGRSSSDRIASGVSPAFSNFSR
jgi:hypothetical protein